MNIRQIFTEKHKIKERRNMFLLLMFFNFYKNKTNRKQVTSLIVNIASSVE